MFLCISYVYIYHKGTMYYLIMKKDCIKMLYINVTASPNSFVIMEWFLRFNGFTSNKNHTIVIYASSGYWEKTNARSYGFFLPIENYLEYLIVKLQIKFDEFLKIQCA